MVVGVISAFVATDCAVSQCTGEVVAYHVVKATAVTAPAAVAYCSLFRAEGLPPAVMLAALTFEPDDVEWVRNEDEAWWRKALERNGARRAAVPDRIGTALAAVIGLTILRRMGQPGVVAVETM